MNDKPANPDEQYELGRKYWKGDGVPKNREEMAYWFTGIIPPSWNRSPQDLKKAVYWYTKAAKQGHALAQYDLGKRYWKGYGVPQDIKKAAYWFTKAAEQGNAEAQLKLGTIDYENDVWIAVFFDDLEKVNYWLTKAAEQGNAVAQMDLGDNYENGIGVKQDLEKADYWHGKAYAQGYERLTQEEIDLLLTEINAGDSYSVISSAAEQGNKSAQYMLGINYWEGDGVPKDLEKAIYWFTKAAEQGDTDAQKKLGYCYANGDGVPKDFEKAHYWFTKVAEQSNKSAAFYRFTKDAEQGNEIAQFHLGYMYSNGNGVPKDLEKAAYWLTKAAEQGNAEAQLRLGTINIKNGVWIADFFENIEKAIYWLTKAAEQGNAEAQALLGDNYEFGIGVKQDQEKADYWHGKAYAQGYDQITQEEIDLLSAVIDAGDDASAIDSAAEQGNKKAQYILGKYWKGDGVPKDLEKTIYWFTKAAEQGDAASQMMLGYCYANGDGVPKDFDKAHYWFTKVAEQSNKSTAFYRFTKDAEQGNEIAQLHLGYMYSNGNGVPKDLEKARYWLSKAAEQNGEAAENAERMLAELDSLH